MDIADMNSSKPMNRSANDHAAYNDVVDWIVNAEMQLTVLNSVQRHSQPNRIPHTVFDWSQL